MLITLGGCGTNNTSGKTDVIEKEEQSEATVSDEEDTEESEETAAEEIADLSLDTTIDETVLLDDGTVKITAKSLEFKYNSPVLNMEFENNGDKALSFISGSLGYSCNSVNDYMVSVMYANVDVAPGKTADESIKIDADELKLYGITNIREIGIGFDIQDDDYNEYLKTGPLTITTSDSDKSGEKQSSFIDTVNGGAFKKAYGYSIDRVTEDDFLDDDNIKVKAEAVMTNKDNEKTVMFEAENVTDKQLYFSTSDIEINGVVMSSGTWKTDAINPGKRAVITIDISKVVEYAGGTLEDYGISDISTLGFNAKIHDFNMNDLNEKEVELTLSDSETSFSGQGEEVYNDNDLRISSQKVTKDEYDNIHILLQAENNSSDEADFDVKYGSLSINDKMIDCIADSLSLKPGKKGIIDIKISSYDLDDAQIEETSDIKNAECTVQIKDDNYKDIDEPVINLSF